MRTAKGEKILEVIRGRIGVENCISAPDICRELRWPIGREREVRRIIATESMLWDVEIIEKAGSGYCVAKDYEEIEENIHWLDELAKTAAQKAQLKRDYFARRGIIVRRYEEMNVA